MRHMTQYARLLLRDQMGTLPTARGLPPYGPGTVEWTPQYAASVALLVHDTGHAAAMLAEFGFPLSVTLAVLTGRMVDLMV